MTLNKGDVWFVDYPYEEDSKQSKRRPVVIVETQDGFSLAIGIKVTTHAPRLWDPFDIEIKEYLLAGFKKPSTARTAHNREFITSKFLRQLGVLHRKDLLNVLRAYYQWRSKNSH